MRLAPPATPRMRPDVRPTKLTRRSASPRGYVFKMMASVSRAGIRCRRADATSNAIPKPVRTARTRGTILLIIRANATQFFPAKKRREPLNIFQHWSRFYCEPERLCAHTLSPAADIARFRARKRRCRGLAYCPRLRPAGAKPPQRVSIILQISRGCPLLTASLDRRNLRDLKPQAFLLINGVVAMADALQNSFCPERTSTTFC